jgi:hypothetical protein
MKKSTFLATTAIIVAGLLAIGTPMTASAIDNTAPVANSDSFTTPIGKSIKITWTELKANDFDLEGHVLKPSTHSNPTHGTVDATKFSGSLGSIVYTPAAGFIGDDTFSYKAQDTYNAVSNWAVVTIHVTNTLPKAGYDWFTTEQDKTLVVSAGGLTANDIDADGDPILTSTSAIGYPEHGTVTMNPLLDGGFTYKPTPGYVGYDTFGYKVVDNHGGVSINPALVTIKITPAVVKPPAVTPVVKTAVTAKNFKATSVKKKHASKITGSFGTSQAVVVIKVKNTKGKTTTMTVATNSKGAFSASYAKKLTKKKGTYSVTVTYKADALHFGLKTYKTTFRVKK